MQQIIRSFSSSLSSLGGALWVLIHLLRNFFPIGKFLYLQISILMLSLMWSFLSPQDKDTSHTMNWLPFPIYATIICCESESCSVVSDSMRPHGLYSPWNSAGQYTGGGSLSLLQGIFPTQEMNWGLLHCKQIFSNWGIRGAHNMMLWQFICMSIFFLDSKLFEDKDYVFLFSLYRKHLGSFV